jgi:hypothetical protein
MSKATGVIISSFGIGAVLTPFIFNPLTDLISVFASVEANIFFLCGVGFVLLSVFAASWYPSVYKKRTAEK